MKRSLLLALLLPMGAMADPIYDINRTIGPGSVVGTMTTDGTIGVLSAANFTAWNLTLYDGTDSFVLSQANSRLRIFGDGLSATASDLLFDFGTAGPVRLFILQGPGDQNGDPFWSCIRGFCMLEWWHHKWRGCSCQEHQYVAGLSCPQAVEREKRQLVQSQRWPFRNLAPSHSWASVLLVWD